MPPDANLGVAAEHVKRERPLPARVVEVTAQRRIEHRKP
jgi:hypothetical protein